jgi:hypothetical protein
MPPYPSDASRDEKVVAYDDVGDLIEESLVVLAQRRAAWLGDDKAAIQLLANLADKTAEALMQRIGVARAAGISWEEIADALGATPTEVRLRFTDRQA